MTSANPALFAVSNFSVRSVGGNSTGEFHQARIFILDDEPVNVILLERTLTEAGFSNIETSTDPREALQICTINPPDLLILDLMMPHINGFALLHSLREKWGANNRIPVLVLTADASRDTCHRALTFGANDFLNKPIDRMEVLLRVQNLIETRLLYKELREANRHLEERVEKRTQDLEIAQIEALEKLAKAAEFRDDDTGEHTYRVGELAAKLSAHIGLLPETVQLIRRAAPLHDVGKIAIPDAILLKPAKLTTEEFDLMKTHAEIGARLLSSSQSPLMQCAERIALTHHERYDGTGYPSKIKGEEIPIEGRILAIVDVYDALTNERPYKKAWPHEQALAEIQRGAGTHFDPELVAGFTTLF
jgi:putative two-component system response regulator